MHTLQSLCLAGCTLFASTGCATDHALILKNNTQVPLTYCPVVTSPPPPHRVVSTTLVAHPERFPMDVEGFNPLFWDPVSGKSVLVQIALAQDPPMILAVVMQHVVPPGSEGMDPALQPSVIAQYPYEVDPADTSLNIVVRVGPVAQGMPIVIVEN